jgi:hypothetical protein
MNVHLKEPLYPVGILTAEGRFIGETVSFHKTKSSKNNCTIHKMKLRSMSDIKDMLLMSKEEKGTAYGPFEIVFKNDEDNECYSSMPILLLTDK